MPHPPLPRIDGDQLIIDGVPTVLLGGQLHNSTPTALALPETVAKIKQLGASLVIGSASWELVEPREGQFQFAEVDRQLDLAEQHDLRLVLLWFGAYKNAASTYAPTWVRADRRRFPRAEVAGQRKQAFSHGRAMPKPVLSVFGPELVEADARAFTALLGYLAQTDPTHRVVMIQIENEIGLLGDSRDRSELADIAWNSAVPPELLPSGTEGGTWPEVFGAGWEAEEIFMAWAYARYVERLAVAGQAAKPLPMYVNAWLGPHHDGQTAGDYPSGGPGWRVLDVWKAVAPSLALLAPDVYEDDAKTALQPYVRQDNPLFIPESRLVAGTAFWALGELGAIGFSPFGLEDARSDGQLAETYGALGPLAAEIAMAQAEGRIRGILLEDGEETELALGDFTILAQGARALLNAMLLDAGVQAPPPSTEAVLETESWAQIPTPRDQRAFGLVILLDPDTFVLVGQNLAIDVSMDGGVVEIDRAESGRYVDGAWQTELIINGDERLQLVPIDRIGAARIKLLRRPADLDITD